MWQAKMSSVIVKCPLGVGQNPYSLRTDDLKHTFPYLFIVYQVQLDFLPYYKFSRIKIKSPIVIILQPGPADLFVTTAYIYSVKYSLPCVFTTCIHILFISQLLKIAKSIYLYLIYYTWQITPFWGKRSDSFKTWNKFLPKNQSMPQKKRLINFQIESL